MRKIILFAIFLLVVGAFGQGKYVHDWNTCHSRQRCAERGLSDQAMLNAIRARTAWLVRRENRNGRDTEVYEGYYTEYESQRTVNFRAVFARSTGNFVTAIRLDYRPTRPSTPPPTPKKTVRGRKNPTYDHDELRLRRSAVNYETAERV